MTTGQRRELIEAMLSALERLDAQGVLSCMSTDVCGIDEVTGTWIHGLDAMTAYVTSVVDAAPSVASTVHDFHESVIGDAALATCVLEQSYEMDGQHRSFSAPTTYAFRVEDGKWKVCLFHSIPVG